MSDDKPPSVEDVGRRHKRNDILKSIYWSSGALAVFSLLLSLYFGQQWRIAGQILLGLAVLAGIFLYPLARKRVHWLLVVGLALTILVCVLIAISLFPNH